MNVGYFVVAFDQATDAVYEDWGIGESYPDESGCSVFTLGINVDYQAELFEDDSITIETLLLDYDEKRIHYVHRMRNAKTGKLSATNECLCMNVNLSKRSSAPFPENVQQLLAEASWRDEWPEMVGRTLQIRR